MAERLKCSFAAGAAARAGMAASSTQRPLVLHGCGSQVLLRDFRTGALMRTESIPFQGCVSCVAMTSAGDRCAAGESHEIGSSWASICVWGTDDFPNTVRTKQAHREAIVALHFSNDGRYLVSAGSLSDGYICVWDASLGTALCRQEHKHSKPITSFCLSPDFTALLCVGAQCTAWDICTARDGQVTLRKKMLKLGALASSPMVAAAFSKGKGAAPYVVTAAGKIVILNREVTTKERTIHTKIHRVTAFAVGSSKAAVGAADGLVEVYSASTLTFSLRLPRPGAHSASEAPATDPTGGISQPRSAVAHLAFGANDACVLALYEDNSLVCWDIGTKAGAAATAGRLWTSSSHTAAIRHAALRPAEPESAAPAELVGTAGDDGMVRLWQPVQALAAPAQELRTGAHGDTQLRAETELVVPRLVQGGDGRTVCAPPSQTGSKSGDAILPRVLAFSSLSEQLVVGDSVGQLHVFCTKTWCWQAGCMAHKGEVSGLVYLKCPGTHSQSQQALASGGTDGRVCVFDSVSQQLCEFDDHKPGDGAKVLVAAALVGKEPVVVSASSQVVFRRPFKQSPFSLTSDSLSSPVVALATLPCMSTVVGVAEDGRMHGWDARTGRVCLSMRLEGALPPASLTCTGGSTALCSFSDGSISVVDVLEGEVLCEAAGHGAAATSAVLLPTSGLALSVAVDGSMKGWQLPEAVLKRAQEVVYPLGHDLVAVSTEPLDDILTCTTAAMFGEEVAPAPSVGWTAASGVSSSLDWEASGGVPLGAAATEWRDFGIGRARSADMAAPQMSRCWSQPIEQLGDDEISIGLPDGELEPEEEAQTALLPNSVAPTGRRASTARVEQRRLANRVWLGGTAPQLEELQEQLRDMQLKSTSFVRRRHSHCPRSSFRASQDGVARHSLASMHDIRDGLSRCVTPTKQLTPVPSGTPSCTDVAAGTPPSVSNRGVEQAALGARQTEASAAVELSHLDSQNGSVSLSSVNLHSPFMLANMEAESQLQPLADPCTPRHAQCRQQSADDDAQAGCLQDVQDSLDMEGAPWRNVWRNDFFGVSSGGKRSSSEPLIGGPSCKDWQPLCLEPGQHSRSDGTTVGASPHAAPLESVAPVHLPSDPGAQLRADCALSAADTADQPVLASASKQDGSSPRHPPPSHPREAASQSDYTQSRAADACAASTQEDDTQHEASVASRNAYLCKEHRAGGHASGAASGRASSDGGTERAMAQDSGCDGVDIAAEPLLITNDSRASSSCIEGDGEEMPCDTHAAAEQAGNALCMDSMEHDAHNRILDCDSGEQGSPGAPSTHGVGEFVCSEDHTSSDASLQQGKDELGYDTLHQRGLNVADAAAGYKSVLDSTGAGGADAYALTSVTDKIDGLLEDLRHELHAAAAREFATAQQAVHEDTPAEARYTSDRVLSVWQAWQARSEMVADSMTREITGAMIKSYKVMADRASKAGRHC